MSTIYLMRAGNTPLYKIGFTRRDVQERRAALQTGNPLALEVVTTWPGTMEDEARLHRLLAPYRREGEWFELTIPSLLTLICQMAALSPPAPKPAPPSAVLKDDALNARVVGDIRTYYLECGPEDETVKVSPYLMDLLRMGVVRGHLWKWYDEGEFRRVMPEGLWDWHRGERGLDACVAEGHVQCQGGHLFRINPEIDLAGYEYIVEISGMDLL